MQAFTAFATWSRKLALVTVAALAPAVVYQAAAEDIEIFANNDFSIVGKPNVLIVLDNSANWSRQSQKWPGGLTQGQSEVRAIKNVINNLEENSVNLGILEYSTDGNANTNEGGYIRHHIRPLSNANKQIVSAKLDQIFNNINSPSEKRSQGNGYGTLFWDIYNYLGELNQSQMGAGTPASLADSAGYLTNYAKFRSPLNIGSSCARTIVIFLGNNTQSGPSKDAIGAIDALKAVGGDTTDIPFAEFNVVEQPIEVDRGYSTACYSTAAECNIAENGADCADQGFSSCYCNTDSAQACSLSKFGVIGTKTTFTVVSDSTEVSAQPVSTGELGITCRNPNQVGSYSCPAPSTSVQANTPMSGFRTTVTPPGPPAPMWRSETLAVMGKSEITSLGGPGLKEELLKSSRVSPKTSG